MPIVPFTSAAPHTVRGHRHIPHVGGINQAKSSPGLPSYEEATGSPHLSVTDVGNQPVPDGWMRARVSTGALPSGHPHTFLPPCGVLPEKVMQELKQVLAKLDRTDLSAARESEQSQLKLVRATDRLQSLRNLGVEPSAPSLPRIGTGLFDDEDPGVDIVHEKRISRAEKKVARLKSRIEQAELEHLKKVRSLQLKAQRIQAKVAPVIRWAPPANPPATGYIRPV